MLDEPIRGQNSKESSMLGIPVRDTDGDILFLNLVTKRKIKTDGLLNYDSISKDGKYMIQEDYSGGYTLSRIIFNN